MIRTTVLIPPDLRNRAERRANQMGISFGELVRRALAGVLEVRGSLEDDPLFADGVVHEGDAPEDASIHHDEHLYGGDR